MFQIQKRSSGKQNLSANREGKHKSINEKRSEQGEQVRLGTIVGMIRGNTSKKRPHEQSEQWLDNEISFPSTLGCQLVDSPIILEALIEGFLELKQGQNLKSPERHWWDFLAKTNWYKKLRSCSLHYPLHDKIPLRQWDCNSDNQERNPPRMSEDRRSARKGPGRKDHLLPNTNEEIKRKDKHPERPIESKPPEKVVIHEDYPDQTVTIRGNLSAKCRFELIEILRRHVDAFAWTPTDMIGIPRVRTRTQNVPSHRAESAKETGHSSGQKKSSKRGSGRMA
ncbi:hypothetical protein Tco_0575797 [Tanacetum coccineum]